MDEASLFGFLRDVTEKLESCDFDSLPSKESVVFLFLDHNEPNNRKKRHPLSIMFEISNKFQLCFVSWAARISCCLRCAFFTTDCWLVIVTFLSWLRGDLSVP